MLNPNTDRNQRHYEDAYRHISVDDLVSKARDAEGFLAAATATDTSWRGLYRGDFRQRLAGRQVLELGCGDGLNALIMAVLGAHVLAIDISKESERLIGDAADRLGLNSGNIQAIGGDFASILLEARRFDYVVGKAFLHHLTHDVERDYLSKTARLLKEDGEARFFEPAVNSKLFDKLRWMVPVRGRPSILQRNAFAAWKDCDPHPQRDNSSAHYLAVGQTLFHEAEIVPMGGVERLHRLLPGREANRRFRRWAHRVDDRLPKWLGCYAARSQLIVYRRPRIAECPANGAVEFPGAGLPDEERGLIVGVPDPIGRPLASTSGAPGATGL